MKIWLVISFLSLKCCLCKRFSINFFFDLLWFDLVYGLLIKEEAVGRRTGPPRKDGGSEVRGFPAGLCAGSSGGPCDL